MFQENIDVKLTSEAVKSLPSKILNSIDKTVATLGVNGAIEILKLCMYPAFSNLDLSWFLIPVIQIRQSHYFITSQKQINQQINLILFPNAHDKKKLANQIT